MKKVILFFLLLSSVCVSAKELSNDVALEKIKTYIENKPYKIIDGIGVEVNYLKINNIKILKRGKYKKEKNYFPIRVRTQGDFISTYIVTKKQGKFDKTLDVKIHINDYDEYEVDIAKVSQTSDSIRNKEKQSELKAKQKHDPLNSYCNDDAGWYKFKASSNLTIRNRPSVKGKKIGLLEKGDIIDGECSVYEVLKNNVSGYWVSINKTGSGDQFVFGHYLTPIDTKHIPIPVKFIGEWNTEACSKGEMSDSKITIKPYAITYLESGGSVKDLEVIDNNSIKFSLLMAGEGESWTSKVILNLEKSSLTMKRDEYTNTYVQCK